MVFDFGRLGFKFPISGQFPVWAIAGQCMGAFLGLGANGPALVLSICSCLRLLRFQIQALTFGMSQIFD